MEKRLESIDVLRGFDMFFIMGFASLVVQLCLAFGWGGDCWLAQQMRHPPWIGLTHHDTIFPLFIFIAGLSFPFSMAKQLERGRTKAQIAWRSLRRMAALILLGMLYERFFMGTPFRFGSVLGRIGISWACASWLFLAFGVRTRVGIAAGILLGYWALNLFVPAPGFTSADVFTPQGNISCWLDRTLLVPLGRISPGTPVLPIENQGLLSTFTCRRRCARRARLPCGVRLRTLVVPRLQAALVAVVRAARRRLFRGDVRPLPLADRREAVVAADAFLPRHRPQRHHHLPRPADLRPLRHEQAALRPLRRTIPTAVGGRRLRGRLHRDVLGSALFPPPPPDLPEGVK